ncbi:MAG: hypothetical protein LUE99_16220 [Bacteroides sp.]|nr:hypothetical protein [Bacteroides sp.]
MMINKPVFIIALFLSSCSNAVKQQENYDVVIVSEYDNTYDKEGRLSKVSIVETISMHSGRDDNKPFVDTSVRTQRYSYTDDACLMTESSYNPNIVETIRSSNDSKEELQLEDEKDTISYSFERYHHNDKDKLEHEKTLWRSRGNSSMTSSFESYHYYDENGNEIKSIYHDLETKKKEETYYFSGITYAEALQRVPKSVNEQKIVCAIKTVDNDTVIIRTTYNGKLEDITKEYTDGNKKIKQKYDTAAELIAEWTDYEEEGLKISTSNTQRPDGFHTDSIFCRNGKKLRAIWIDSTDMMKMVVTSEYDIKGNLVREVTKTKHSGM